MLNLQEGTDDLKRVVAASQRFLSFSSGRHDCKIMRFVKGVWDVSLFLVNSLVYVTFLATIV